MWIRSAKGKKKEIYLGGHTGFLELANSFTAIN